MLGIQHWIGRIVFAAPVHREHGLRRPRLGRGVDENATAQCAERDGDESRRRAARLDISEHHSHGELNLPG